MHHFLCNSSLLGPHVHTHDGFVKRNSRKCDKMPPVFRLNSTDHNPNLLPPLILNWSLTFFLIFRGKKPSCPLLRRSTAPCVLRGNSGESRRQTESQVESRKYCLSLLMFLRNFSQVAKLNVPQSCWQILFKKKKTTILHRSSKISTLYTTTGQLASLSVRTASFQGLGFLLHPNDTCTLGKTENIELAVVVWFLMLAPQGNCDWLPTTPSWGEAGMENVLMDGWDLRRMNS